MSESNPYLMIGSVHGITGDGDDAAESLDLKLLAGIIKNEQNNKKLQNRKRLYRGLVVATNGAES